MPNPHPFELPRQEPCYFCSQLDRENPPALVFGSETAAVLVNARQHQEGQLLGVPCKHAPTLLELRDHEAAELMKLARSAAAAIIDVFSPDGLLIYQNNGVASGQEVPHFHLHVVPQRFEHSRWGNEPPHVADAQGRDFEPHEPTFLDDAALADMAGRIRKVFRDP